MEGKERREQGYCPTPCPPVLPFTVGTNGSHPEGLGSAGQKGACDLGNDQHSRAYSTESVSACVLLHPLISINFKICILSLY